MLITKQQEDARNERTKKEKIEKESNEYAKEEWSKSKKIHKADVRYMFFVFLISLLPISIGLVLSIYQPIKTYLNSISENYLLFIVLVVILIYVIEGIGSKYFFDKEKIKNGWKYLFKHKSIKNSMIKKFKNDYIEQATQK